MLAPIKRRHRGPSGVAALLLVLVLTMSGTVSQSLAQALPAAATSIPENAPAIGPPDAAVTIVEFSDFQCPFCRAVAPLGRELVSAYPGKVRYVFRHNPLPMHRNAVRAHEAALAAGEQGKFWEMHDLLFANQRSLGSDDLLRFAQQLGLDQSAFVDALARPRFLADIERDRSEANRLGVTGTPTFFVNGRLYRGALTRSEFNSIIDSELRGASGSEIASNRPEIDLAAAPTDGPDTALVRVVVFSDFACPHSRAMSATLAELRKKFPDRLRLAFKHFPATGNPSAQMTHQLAVAAAEQGKFWEWYERAFALQPNLRPEVLREAATKAGLSGIDWEAEHPLEAFRPAVDRDIAEGRRLGVRGTPTLFINGTRLQGTQPLSVLEGVVAGELQRIAQKLHPPADVRASRLARGPVDAPVVIVWYADVQSPLARRTSDLLVAAQRSFPHGVRVVFRHRPLEFHPQARIAHEALEVAADNDKFWEMLELVQTHPSALGRSDLASYAKRIGLRRMEFLTALESGRFSTAVEQDLNEAERLDIRGVPVLFVNHIRIEGVPQEYQLRQMIEAELRKSEAANASAARPIP